MSFLMMEAIFSIDNSSFFYHIFLYITFPIIHCCIFHVLAKILVNMKPGLRQCQNVRNLYSDD